MDRAAALSDLLRLEAQICALEARKAELKRDLKEEALQELELTGMAPTWRAKGLGCISLVTGNPTPFVVDDAKFVEWARNVDWTWVETVERVKPMVATEILRECRVNGERVFLDGEEIPGAAVAHKPAHLRVQLDKEAKAEALREAAVAYGLD